MTPVEKIVYLSADGIEFATEEECREHEARLNSYKMYDLYGAPTNDTNNAHTVYIPHSPYDTGSAVGFIEACKAQQTGVDGIDPDDYGWFIWDTWTERYNYISGERLKGIAAAVASAPADAFDD